MMIRRTFIFYLLIQFTSAAWWGQNYWNDRYNLGYGNWRGFWNDQTQWKGYQRKDVIACPGHCNCKRNVKTLKCANTIANIGRQYVFDTLDADSFPDNAIEINIERSNLANIHPDAFKKKTLLKKLKITYSKLNEMPDLTGCQSLEILDLYSNSIQLFRHNFTRLPSSVKWITLIKNKIYKIPDGYFNLPNLQYLGLGENLMKYFPGDAFSSAPNLEYLGADANKISSISRRDLENLAPLNKFVHLNISNNEISYIEPKAFKTLSKLKILELHGNIIETVQKNVFWKIPELLHLALNHNKIKKLTSQFITDCENLKVIFLHTQKKDYEMDTVYFDSLQKLPKLNDLYMGENKLTRFPQPLFFEEIWNIANLYLDNNQLTNLRDYSEKDFPASALVYYLLEKKSFHPFEKMPSLIKLDVQSNQIDEIREKDLEYCKSLQYFDASSNKLQESTIHRNAFQNTSLRSLTLNSQTRPGIQYVPMAITANAHPNLQEIYLESNMITYILNGTFSHLPELLSLYLEGNQIIAIEDGAFPIKLRNLLLAGNKFRFKNQNQFSGLKNLKVLDLQSNQIDVIPDQAFHGLEKLERLYLQNNKIGRILKVHFQDTNSLLQLELQHNEIAFIEDGTFANIRRHFPSKNIEKINLEGNQLTRIPVTDFWNVNIRQLSFKSNSITEISENTFVNISKPCNEINLHRNRIERIRAYAFSNIICNQINIGGNQPIRNPVKIIEGYAYYNVKVSQLDLSYLQVKNIPSYAFKLNGLNNDLYLNNGKLQLIETSAFDLGQVTGNIHLADNDIVDIRKRIFVKGTSFTDLYLHQNQLSLVNDFAFDGATMSGKFYAQTNKLKTFPTKALSVFTGMTQLRLSGNEITDLPAGSLDPFTKMSHFEMEKNKLTKIPKGIFKKNLKLRYVKLGWNHISTLEAGVFNFDGVPELKQCKLESNPIDHVPQFTQKMPHMEQLLFGSIKTVAKDVFGSNLPKLSQLQIKSSRLQCDCQLYDTLLKYYNGGKSIYESTPVCDEPIQLKGFNGLKSKARLMQRKNDFICTPLNIIITTPADYTIQIDYTYPDKLHAGVSKLSSSEILYFEATCKLIGDGAVPEVKAGVKNKQNIVISDTEKVLPGREYRCHLVMSYVSSSGINITSAQTESIYTTTLERKGKATLCSSGQPYECQTLSEHSTCITGCDIVASNDIRGDACDPSGCCKFCYKSCVKCNNTVKGTTLVDIRYYDFSVDDSDFNSLVYTPDDCCPRYVPSPYETWLAKQNSDDPKTDTFSEWFRSSSSRNIAVDEQLTLLSEGDIDPVNGKEVFVFWDANYWAVNGKGYKAQGQKDCGKGNELLNLGFTSAIRTGFTFFGEEHFHFAGGEDLWVYVNKVLVLHIISQDPKNATITCKTFQLKNVSGNSGSIVPRVGVVDPASKSCTNLHELPDQAVSLKLQVGINYGLDIFHVERFPCSSEFLFRASGVAFISSEDLKYAKPRIDYLAYPPEDIHVKAIIGDIILTDEYNSKNPYTVTLQSGNEEERFTLEDNTTAAHVAANSVPPPRIYKNVTLYGEPVIICPNSTNATSSQIPKTKFGAQNYNIDTKSALITLKNNLDYESTNQYLLRITVTDADGTSGNITVMVMVVDQSDNCPIMALKPVLNLKPIPPLQVVPLFIVQATDADSGNNGRITYMTSEIISKIPTIASTSYEEDGITKFENTTKYWTVTLNVFAVDNGNPRRGDYFPFTIKYHASCETMAKVVVNATTGDVHFTAPAMTNWNVNKSRYGKENCYECTAGYFCPGDGRELNCVQNETTRHYYSYGFRTECLPCPEGWLCHNGTIRKCADNTYVKCNTTWCPKECFPCPAGVYCHEGVQQECKAGAFGDGKGPCQLCRPGSFSNTSKSSDCACCPAGYESTYMKDGCQECRHREFSTGTCSICQSCNDVDSLCACENNPCFKGVRCHNRGPAGKRYYCDKCPDGYNGDGKTCGDVNECAVKPCFGECINLSPGYKCSGCKPGYNGNAPAGVGLEQAQSDVQICNDIDECANSSFNLCDPNADCINTNGSYVCGKCKPGFVGDGYLGCRLGDYCATGRHNCHSNATCIPLGSEKFYCKCKDGYAGDGNICAVDHDYDGISTFGAACHAPECKEDKCEYTPNGGQEDNDSDALGDVCDSDDDDDNIPDINDNCPFQRGRNQSDSDGDRVGDLCDNCMSVANFDQSNVDGDEYGDLCDDDIDGDGIANAADNCAYVSNPGQEDGDRDGVGDVCDNCYKHANDPQIDSDQNMFGDACDGVGRDVDGDGIPNDYDNCRDTPNADQANKDGDELGDFCDGDKDGDGVLDEKDNCVYVANPAQNHTTNYDMLANPVGVACVDDFDGDGVFDKDDVCPYASNLHDTSFKKYTLIDLADPTSTEPKPRWRVTNNGRDIEQLQKTLRPSILVGKQFYSEVEYSGVLHVNNDEGIDYIGVVFGFQSNKKFLVAIWRHQNINYQNETYKAGIKGMQIKLVNSSSGPSEALTQALWHSADTYNEVQLLWHDPKMMGWVHRTSYIFVIEFRPSLGRIRLKIKRGVEVITDSGYLYETAITGGRLGVYTHGQSNVIWSRLKARCLQRLNRALMFDGNTSCVALPTLRKLDIRSSFTVGLWIKLHSGYPMVNLPLICNKQQTLCLYILEGFMHGTIDKTNVRGVTKLTADNWTHLSMRYDAQGRFLDLFKDGAKISSVVVPKLTLDVSDSFYVGCDGTNFYQGLIDEITIWNVYLQDSELNTYMKMTGLVWPRHQRLVTAHYTIDQDRSDVLIDQSEHGNNANVTSVAWVESSLDETLFKLNHPNNKRKKRYVHSEL